MNSMEWRKENKINWNEKIEWNWFVFFAEWKWNEWNGLWLPSLKFKEFHNTGWKVICFLPQQTPIHSLLSFLLKLFFLFLSSLINSWMKGCFSWDWLAEPLTHSKIDDWKKNNPNKEGLHASRFAIEKNKNNI